MEARLTSPGPKDMKTAGSASLIVDIDLTLYSLAEFLSSHRYRPDRWAQALWRFNPETADAAIDEAWRKWERTIESRIHWLKDFALKQWGHDPLFVTANPLTDVKRESFTRLGLEAVSTYPLKKAKWLEQRPNFELALLSVGDRWTDAPLARNFMQVPIRDPIHRLKGDAYSRELQERLCFKVSSLN